MAPSREKDVNRNDAISSDQITEETTAIPSLPFEIIEEILYMLPVKFLMRLKSVCKSWKSLISDPKFAKKHLRMSPARHHVLVTYTNRPSDEFVVVDYPFSSVFTELTATAATQLDFPLPSGNRLDFIVGSCHGIICFLFNEYSPVLWNPSIRKFMKLPPSSKNVEPCYTHFGFGYVIDGFNDNYIYKVVNVNYYYGSDDYYFGPDHNDVIYKSQVKVYTLGTNSWRLIQDFPYGIPLTVSGIFVSETLNWLVSNNSNTSHVIISLDLDKETYQQIMQPDYGLEIMVTRNLAVLRDCLSILAVSDTFSDVWLMKEFGNKESWTKLFRIPRSCMGDLHSAPDRPLYLLEDDQVLLECEYKLQSERQFELAVYNSRDRTFKTAEIQKTNRSLSHEVYQESFIMPCS